ncbi:MAG: PIG-L deacetylase family protein [Candidatus Heimdallarchaeaceae archaeon]
MKLSFIFAHPDDESLSCGGTIAKYSDKGHQVSTLCLSSTQERKREYLEATKILNVHQPLIFDFNDVLTNSVALKEEIIKHLLDFQPDKVITHLKEDYHIDHRTTFEIVLEAIEWAAHETQFANPHLVSQLYTTETIVLLPSPHILVDISNYYRTKEEAIRCYKSQLFKGGEDFYIKFHKYRTLMRGTQASTEYAEAFQQVPLKKNSPFYRIKHSEL